MQRGSGFDLLWRYKSRLPCQPDTTRLMLGHDDEGFFISIFFGPWMPRWHSFDSLVDIWGVLGAMGEEAFTRSCSLLPQWPAEAVVTTFTCSFIYHDFKRYQSHAHHCTVVVVVVY